MHSDLFNDKTKLAHYKNNVWRVVESQAFAATSQLVDDADEQLLLESLLDENKPAYRQGTEKLHYLLKTAFRYPPLKWGSRFGTRQMPSYFYASEELQTALCESAYYRFVFLDDMLEAYDQPIRSEHSAFRVLLESNSVLDLTLSAYRRLQTELQSPNRYATSQALGDWVLERADVDMICFYSAREPQGRNVAVLHPKSIRSRQPNQLHAWHCLTKANTVSFSSRESQINFIFERARFCDAKGQLYRAKP